MSKLPIVMIIGPTASRKSGLAVKLAKKFGGEVISADSRQIYRGLDIGSGKISKKEMRGIPHHLLDIANPKGHFSVVEYYQLAEKTIREIISRGKVPIVAGGSGMYVDAVLHGAPYPEVRPNPILRKKLEKKSCGMLFLMLKKKDPRRARTIDQKNKRRLIRALEIITETGQPVPLLKKNRHYKTLLIGIRVPKKKLRRLIARRLRRRLKEGLIAEVRKLRTKGLSPKRLFELGLEYRFVGEFQRGALSRSEMEHRLLAAINQYAKRQMTWFRRYKDVRWIRTKKQAERLISAFLNK